MSEANNKNVRNDEIDLLDLFKRMGRSLGKMARALGRGTLISIVFLLRNWLPLGLSIALGIGVSFLVKMNIKPFYNSDLVLKNNAYSAYNNSIISEPSTGDLIKYINVLHKYCKERNTTALCKALSLTPQQVKNIIDISAYWFIDQANDGTPDFVDYQNNSNLYDTINVRMEDRFNIRVKTNLPQELTDIRNGIINFVNADSLFQQRNRARLRQSKETLARLSIDISQLDSLQKVKYFEETRNKQPQSGGQMIFLQEQKTQLVYTDIYILLNKKQVLEYESDLYRDIITVLSDFSIPTKRVNGLMYYSKKSVPLFFVLTILVLIIITNRKKIKEVFEKY